MNDKTLTPNDYQKLALRTEVTPDFINPAFIEERKTRGADGGLDAKQLGRLIHAELGCCTEVGESQDMVKKALIYGKPFDRVNVLEECGDTLWYIALALDACGYTMEQAMRANIEKLLKRFPQKFTEEQAINRDTDAERKVLEGNGVRCRVCGFDMYAALRPAGAGEYLCSDITACDERRRAAHP